MNAVVRHYVITVSNTSRRLSAGPSAESRNVSYKAAVPCFEAPWTDMPQVGFLAVIVATP